MRVHNALGSGFPEKIYQRALEIEFEHAKLRFARELARPIFYKDVHIGTRRVDFLVNERIVVELKAVAQLEEAHLAQALNYLEAFKLEIGLLINFGNTRLQFKRLIKTRQ